jgi:hypothetical protein
MGSFKKERNKTMKIDEIMDKIKSTVAARNRAHEAIDDFYKYGRYDGPGFGPMGQSQIIAGCNSRLAELRNELIKLGVPARDAEEAIADEPSGYIFEKIQEFIAKHSA